MNSSGAVAGLVCITPGSGYVSPPFSLIFGIFGGVACNLAVKLKHVLDFDDALDVFAVHAVGGIVGNVLLGKTFSCFDLIKKFLHIYLITC